MSEDNVSDAPQKPYVKTAMLGAAIVLPVLGWCGRQLLLGAKSAINGKDNFVSDEDWSPASPASCNPSRTVSGNFIFRRAP